MCQFRGREGGHLHLRGELDVLMGTVQVVKEVCHRASGM
jgi:hypothetical protein